MRGGMKGNALAMLTTSWIILLSSRAPAADNPAPSKDGAQGKQVLSPPEDPLAATVPALVESLKGRDEKVRVYALARELNVESKDLLDLCKQAGFDVKNQLSSLDPEQRDQIEALIKKGGVAVAVAPAPAKAAAPAVLPDVSKTVRNLDTRPARREAVLVAGEADVENGEVWMEGRHGIIERRFYEQHPPRAEYVLTDKGRQLGPVLKTLLDWGRKHTAATAVVRGDG